MNLQPIHLVTPSDKTTDIVDLDRNGGEEDHPQALIVARVFEPEVLRLFMTIAMLVEHHSSIPAIIAKAKGERL